MAEQNSDAKVEEKPLAEMNNDATVEAGQNSDAKVEEKTMAEMSSGEKVEAETSSDAKVEKKTSQNVQDYKKLALLIVDFLIDEKAKKHHCKKVKQSIDKATRSLEKAYKIKLPDYWMLRRMKKLQDIFTVGCNPLPIKILLAAESHKTKGNEYMDARRYSLAELEYSKAMDLDPNNAIYYCNRAASRVRQGLFLEAVSDCKKSLELDRNYVNAYNWLGLAHAMTNQPAKALRYYRKALRIEPDNLACVENMSFISRKLNHTKFRALKPLHRYSRDLLRAAATMNRPKLCRRKKESWGDWMTPEEKRNSQIQKFNLDDVD